MRDACNTLKAVVFMGEGETPKGLHAYEALIEGASAAKDARRRGDDLAGIFYTGGTTGLPKGVMLSHQGLWSSAMSVGTALQLDSEARYLHAAPMFHLADGGMTYSTTIGGGSHIVMPAFEPAAFLEVLGRERAEPHALLVPTMIRLLVDCPDLERRDTSSWKQLVYGSLADGGVAAARLRWRACRTSSSFKLMGRPSFRRCAVCWARTGACWKGRKAGKLRSAGRPGLCVEANRRRGWRRAAARGVVGEVWVRGPNTMLGYWNKPEQTAATLVDGWVRTGDGGYMDEDGFIYIVDRMKDMIVSGGENVFSAEVENALMQHPAVSECAVIGVPDDKWGERVHAIVVPREGADVGEDAVIAHCKSLIAGYKCPRSVEVRREPLPKSGAGKILKIDLRKPYWEGQARNVN
ncbi:MAG: AMP-binding protein [Hyphomonadaceae bacterium]